MTRFRVEVRSGTTWPSPQVLVATGEFALPGQAKTVKKFAVKITGPVPAETETRNCRCLRRNRQHHPNPATGPIF